MASLWVWEWYAANPMHTTTSSVSVFQFISEQFEGPPLPDADAVKHAKIDARQPMKASISEGSVFSLISPQSAMGSSWADVPAPAICWGEGYSVAESSGRTRLSIFMKNLWIHGHPPPLSFPFQNHIPHYHNPLFLPSAQPPSFPFPSLPTSTTQLTVTCQAFPTPSTHHNIRLQAR